MKPSVNFVTIRRPDGQQLHINTNQIIYITSDPVDESGKKTEIVTTQGAFIITKPVDEVRRIVLGEEIGEL